MGNQGCPAALRGVLKGEGASATTAPKCKVHQSAKNLAGPGPGLRAARRRAAAARQVRSQSRLKLARAPHATGEILYVQRGAWGVGLGVYTKYPPNVSRPRPVPPSTSPRLSALVAQRYSSILIEAAID